MIVKKISNGLNRLTEGTLEGCAILDTFYLAPLFNRGLLSEFQECAITDTGLFLNPYVPSVQSSHLIRLNFLKQKPGNEFKYALLKISRSMKGITMGKGQALLTEVKLGPMGKKTGRSLSCYRCHQLSWPEGFCLDSVVPEVHVNFTCFPGQSCP